MARRRRNFMARPPISKEAQEAAIRQAAAGMLDGRYRHPAGGIAVKCPECNGAGRLVALSGDRCPHCRGSGVVEASQPNQGDGDKETER